MRKYLTLALLPVGLAVASLAFAGAQAPMSQQSPSSNVQPAPSAQVDDATLIKFDQAVFAMRKVRKEYAPKMQAASTDSEKAQIKQQEKKDASVAISQHMPISQFMQIEKQVRHDPALKARARQLASEHKDQMQPGSTGTQ
ncbi:MAG: DUF4168 domain-containing protein [Gammaproteobacteria bacterium]